MRKALSIVLAGLLVMTPPKLVLAQAAQQEAVGVQQAVPSDDAAAHLFRIQPLTQNSALLFNTSSDRALLDTPFADAPLAQQEPDGGWWGSLDMHWRIFMVVAVVAVTITSLYLIVRNACPVGGCYTES